MSLRSKIKVNTHYTRSINLERDAGSEEVVASYIPTSRALRTLERVAVTFSGKAGPRAWSLVGPYGSGKSSFSVFLSQLLSNDGDVARRVLWSNNRSLAGKYRKEVNESAGYLEVLITGTPEPLGKRIVKGLAKAATDFWQERPGRNNRIVDVLHSAAEKSTLTTSEVIEALGDLQEELKNVNGSQCRGILFIVDELGKFLEYEARHYGANDIYLLQALAEHAAKGGGANFLMFVLLHQSFEQYAKGLGENLRNEWAKVQGRFEEIPFVESAEQVLKVVGAAFEHDFTKKELNEIRKEVRGIVQVLRKEKAIPGALSDADATNLFAACYPLHPVSSILLPFLCQKVAQNERTLFSYLGSYEDYGLQHLLEEMGEVGEWVYPHHIYDYFINNQVSILGDYLTHRRWVEVVTAIERLGDAPETEIQLLKTIGVLNVIGSKGGFKASSTLLQVGSRTKRQCQIALNGLKEKAIITHRKFNNEYRVWQGSDFDLDAALIKEKNNYIGFDLAQELNNRQNMLPIVARKYTIKNGALRYFAPHFMDATSIRKPIEAGLEPRFVFYLAKGPDDINRFKKEGKGSFSSLDLVVLCLNGEQLSEITGEVKGLEQVEKSCQELNTDAVARREFEDRLSAACSRQQELLQELVGMSEANEWYWNGKKQRIRNHRDLQQTMSEILSTVYDQAPTIQNELINRDRPSSQAAAGRNKLLCAMLKQPAKADLGIEKFPPEKAMYRALLREHGLHRKKKNNQWAFSEPEEDSSIYPVWQRIIRFLESTEKTPRSFAALSKELVAPPYGVKEGVLPILYTAALLVFDHEVAVYENRRYIPYLTEELLERFVKRPEEYLVQRFHIEGLRASIFEQYNKALFGDGKSRKKRTIIDFAKPLAIFIGELEEYTKKTKSSDLAVSAKQVRDAFSRAKSPEQLLFNDLPIALGFDPSMLERDGAKSLEGFAKKLTESLRELKYCFAGLLDKQRILIAQAFHMDENTELEQMRRKAMRYEGLDQHTVDVGGLKAFIKRLTKVEGDDKHWFVNILMFLGQKPPEKWTDADRAEAEVKLSDYSKRILDLETLRLYYDKSAKNIEGDFDVILLKSLRKGEEPIDEVVAIDKKRHQAVRQVKEEMRRALYEHQDVELRLAAIAELVDDFLSEYRASQCSKVKSGNSKAGRSRRVVNE